MNGVPAGRQDIANARARPALDVYIDRMGTSREPAGSIALALGPAAALLIAGVLSGVRDDLGATNVALILACLVVAAAIAGRQAGVATAIIAAVSFNFFHTQPYESLRIDDGKDIVTVVLLAVLGIVVSEIANRRRSASEDSKAHLRGEHALELVASQLAHRAGPQAVWSDVQTSLVSALDLAECRFEPGITCELPLLPRSGSLLAKQMHWDRGGFELPATGAALEVAYDGRTYGHVVMVPRGRAGSSIEARRMAVGLTDQYGVALALDEYSRTEPGGASPATS